jgi:tRNA 2-thiouridine synthesizing protein E
VIKYIRSYFDIHQKVPELRELLKNFKQKHGENKSTRKYIYMLFPYGYGQQACKISGMRQPKKLWLDL